MKLRKRITWVLACLVVVVAVSVQAAPPFDGTIFLEPDIITSADGTAFESISYAGQGMRTMFDRRSNSWIDRNAYLFHAKYDDGLIIEIQVNPEFGSSGVAQTEAEEYGRYIGQLPTVLRLFVETVWIHRGEQSFGGGNNNILIHVGQAASYVSEGILEEALLHEACHSSLDGIHAAAADWLAAQSADGEFISIYARDNPDREDVAESFLLYYAYRYRSDRISQSLKNTIEQTMPNRIEYFDDHVDLDAVPAAKRQTCSEESSFRSAASSQETTIGFLNGTNQVVELYWINFQAQRRSPPTVIEPYGWHTEHSFVGHHYVVTTTGGECLSIYTAEDIWRLAIIGR